MSYKIETHDYEVRLRNAKKFLNQGNRVRGREGRERGGEGEIIQEVCILCVGISFCRGMNDFSPCLWVGVCHGIIFLVGFSLA